MFYIYALKYKFINFKLSTRIDYLFQGRIEAVYRGVLCRTLSSEIRKISFAQYDCTERIILYMVIATNGKLLGF